MKEFVGACRECGKAIHCENGFFNGIVLPGHDYLCFDCAEKEEDVREE